MRDHLTLHEVPHSLTGDPTITSKQTNLAYLKTKNIKNYIKVKCIVLPQNEFSDGCD